MMKSEATKNTFNFLKDLALELGATEAKILPATEIVVENRVVLKCRIGCNKYGKTLMCPPYAPSVDEFRKILSEYSYALVFKIKSNAEATAEVAKLLSKKEDDPSLTEEMKEKIQEFWASWKADKKELVTKICALEKAATTEGYTLALGFTTGSCMICDDCNVKEKLCKHPTEARYSAQAVGINVLQTLDNAGMPISVPFKKNPESFGLVLIT
jgi:predicted metal-binding protein